MPGMFRAGLPTEARRLWCFRGTVALDGIEGREARFGSDFKPMNLHVSGIRFERARAGTVVMQRDGQWSHFPRPNAHTHTYIQVSNARMFWGFASSLRLKSMLRERERQYPNDTIEARFGTIFWIVRCDGTKWRWHGKGEKARPTGLCWVDFFLFHLCFPFPFA